MKHNILLDVDAYKHSHAKMLDPTIDSCNIYFESRGGIFKETYFFGLQYILQEYLSKGISKKDLKEAAPILDNLGTGYFKEGFEYIVNKLGGKLPIVIEAVSEGTVVPIKNVLFQIRSTDKKVPWLASFLETCLMRTWYPITVASLSHAIRVGLDNFAIETSDNPNVDYHLNDFGSRGVSSYESSAIGGAAHLCIFKGSDNIPGLKFLKDYYNHKETYPISIPATEHSVTTSYGIENEYKAIERFITMHNDSPVSIVIDSYDDEKCMDFIGTHMKEHIIQRKFPVICRPDNGDPSEKVVMVFNKLDKYFGTTINSKGYKVLPPYVRIIQGDGIDIDSIMDILANMLKHKISLDNVVFGMGGALLQLVNRDTMKFAIKTSEVTLNDGTVRDVYKDPKGCSGKVSKKGRLALIKEDGIFKTIRFSELGSMENLLVPVFENGKLLKTFDFNDVKYKG